MAVLANCERGPIAMDGRPPLHSRLGNGVRKLELGLLIALAETTAVKVQHMTRLASRLGQSLIWMHVLPSCLAPLDWLALRSCPGIPGAVSALVLELCAISFLC